MEKLKRAPTFCLFSSSNICTGTKGVRQTNKVDFIKCVRDMERKLYRVCRAMRLNDADAQDAVQEALLKAYKNIESLREDRYFETWLIRILINEARAILRRSQKADQPLDEKIPVIPEGENSVAAAILSLPEKERLCLTLHAIEGYGLKEIAEITKSPVGTVKWRLKKARDRLKETLEKEDAL